MSKRLKNISMVPRFYSLTQKKEFLIENFLGTPLLSNTLNHFILKSLIDGPVMISLTKRNDIVTDLELKTVIFDMIRLSFIKS